MATQLQSRRGTTAQMNAFTGAEGEIAVNTSTDTLHVHDGSTAGGHALAKADGSNIATYAGSFTTISASGTITGDITGDLTGSVLTAAQTNITSVGTLSALTVSGALTVDTDTLVVDATNNRVGIGNSSPDSYFSNASNLVVGGATGANGMTISGSTDTQIFFADGTSGADAYRGIIRYSHADNGFSFWTDATERMRIDASGRVGIAAVPSAWTYFSPIQAKRSSFAGSDGQTGVGYNWYFDGAYKYIANDYALAYQQNATSGAHSWSTAASGTAGATATLTERMRIDASGNVGIGTSSPRTLVNASSATGAILTLESSDTSLTTNGVIGGIDFYSNDSSTNGTGAKVNIRAIGQNSSGTATALTFGTSSSGSATAVEAMRIDASGNVGIGTSSPSAKLQISQNSNGAYVTSSIVNTNAGGYSNLTLTAGSATSGIYYAPGIFFAVGPASGDTTTPIVFRNNNATERMRIDSSGNLLVGHTGQLSASKFLVSFDGTSHNAYVARTTRTGINSNFAVFLNSSNQVAGTITHNGSTTVNYSASSDQRLKENIEDADASGGTIDAIQVRKFDWIDDGAHEKYGFIAQELKTVVPNAVSSMGMPDEEDPMLGVDPSKLMGLAIKEIQSLRSRVAELENN